MLLLNILLSCGSSDNPSSADADLVNPEDPLVTWLSRASVDLRGRRLSSNELTQIAQNPELADSMLDEMLDDPALPEQIAWAWNDVFHTAMWAPQYDRFGGWEFETWKALGWEPMAAIALLVENEQAYTDLVTLTELPLHPKTAELWELESAQSDWHWAPPGDERPMAGLLSSRVLWMRYTADTFNFNRQRASALSKMFLCADFLDRDGTFEFNALADSLANVEEAIRTEPGCISCHSALDPLAAFFGGFSELSTDLLLVPYTSYSSVNARWASALQSKAYFGQPGETFSDVGDFVAADPRFTQCAVETLMQGFLGTKPVRDHTFWSVYADFQDSGFQLKALAKSIVKSNLYQDTEPRLLRAHQFHSVLAAVADAEEGTDTDGLGPLKWSWRHRLLYGEGDDVNILEPSKSVGVSTLLMTEWASREMAQRVASAIGSDEPLVALVVDDSEASARQQISHWMRVMLNLPVENTDSQVDALVTLWKSAGGADDLELAYGTVMAALVRHPEMVLK